MVNICYPVVHLESILSRLANRDIMMGETSAKKSRNKELKTLIGRAEVVYEVILGKTYINVDEFLDNKELVVAEASKGVKLTGSDPHVWLAPLNAKKEMENIKDALISNC